MSERTFLPERQARVRSIKTTVRRRVSRQKYSSALNHQCTAVVYSNIVCTIACLKKYLRPFNPPFLRYPVSLKTSTERQKRKPSLAPPGSFYSECSGDAEKRDEAGNDWQPL